MFYSVVFFEKNSSNSNWPVCIGKYSLNKTFKLYLFFFFYVYLKFSAIAIEFKANITLAF